MHPIHRVSSFTVLDAHTIHVTFEDGVAHAIDFEPVLEGELYGPLRDPLLFAQVSLDPEAGTLVWPNGADFDPATLHEWPAVAERFAAMARRWASSGTAGRAAGRVDV